MIRNKKKVIGNLKLEEEEKKKENISKMIIINGIFFVLSHLPEFLTMLLLVIFQNKLKDFCFYYAFRCDQINEMAQFFNYFFIIAQFYINNKFNKVFNESYHDLKIQFKKRLKLV